MSRTRHTENQFSLDLGESPETAPHPRPEPPMKRAVMDIDAVLANLDDMQALLSQWRQQEWLRPLDVEFAGLIRSLTEEQGDRPKPLVLLLAALASHQVGRGHVCIDLDNLLADAGNTLSLPPEETTLPGGDASETPGSHPDLPPPDQVLARVTRADCVAALEASSAVSSGAAATPLILEKSRLYLRRFWRYEQRIADGIRLRLAQPSPLADPQSDQTTTLGQALEVLFSPQPEVNYQKLACALAARNRFAVITGGPGTGKTTTVVNLLAALQAIAGTSSQRAGRKYRIRLAAPTGKAAARLNESIGNAASRLPLDRLPGQVTLDDIPTRVTTLHRLLGSRPETRQFRHNRDNPLLVDILVIDEASMVDMDLMASVFDALPAGAQLILLGDKDQLASVDAGAVLGELCHRAPEAHYTGDTAHWLQAITGEDIPDHLLDPSGVPLDQAVAMLRKSYRFQEDSGIRKLAEAVNDDRLDDDTLTQVRQGGYDDVIWLNGDVTRPQTDDTLTLICNHAVTGTPEAFRNQGQGRKSNGEPMDPPVGHQHYLSLMNQHALGASSNREDWDELARNVLAAFSDFQVLCALRKGPWGVEGLNERIAQRLLGERLITRAEGWYAGRPVLVTGNDYNLGLMNGDVGITFSLPWDRDENGDPKPALRVAFPAGDGTGGIRWISPSRLQRLETVYAMTVHKSQGSEFNHTCLVLPDRLSPVLTRELIYTGITRARNWFSLITGDAGVLREAVGHRVVRASGLASQLARP